MSDFRDRTGDFRDATSRYIRLTPRAFVSTTPPMQSILANTLASSTMHKPRERTAFMKAAHKTGEIIEALRQLLMKYKKDDAYLLHITEPARDSIEHEVTIVIKRCKDQIDILKNMIYDQEANSKARLGTGIGIHGMDADYVAHKVEVVSILSENFQSVTSDFDKLRSVCFQDAFNRNSAEVAIEVQHGPVRVQDQTLYAEICVLLAKLSSLLDDCQQQEQECSTLTGDSFIRPHIRKLQPYLPILPFEVLSARLGRKPEDIVKLDANENPYGPPPEVFEALGTMKFPYIYPDPESRRLRAALAKDSGLESNYILAGCGADELIDLIMRCVLEPNDKIVDCPPTFTMYEFDAAVNGALVIKVPRKLDFSLDVEQIAKVVDQEKPKCIFLTSPNNPDGSIIDDETLLKILKLPLLVVLDEAYIEFSGIESRMRWVKEHENLIVLRSFSERAGLAGLPVGYGAFPLSIIEYLWRAKQPYNVSVAAELAACAALTNSSYLENVKVALVEERERLYKLLKEVAFLNPYPSSSNFILCEVTSGMDAKKLKEDLAEMGVLIRHYNNKELSGYVRISVGKPEQTDALMKSLKSLL